jgi:glyoxylate reductase
MTTLPRVFVTRQIHHDALELIGSRVDMEVWPHEDPPSPLILRQKVRDVVGVLTTLSDKIDHLFFDSAPRLKVVSQIAVGVDNIDVAEATRRGIPVGHTPEVLSKATADLTFALLMTTARRVAESNQWVKAGRWRLAFHPLHWLGADVSGATIGIVGMGQIGLEVAKRAQGFDMDIIYHSRTPKPEAERQYGAHFVDLATLLRFSDFITIHVPLTPQTHHMIGEKELSFMKPTAILINTSRGSVVNSMAIYNTLINRKIAGAALDVTDPEPIQANSPLLSLDNVIITPHIGSASHSSRRAMAMMSAQNLVSGLSNEHLTRCVNPEAYIPQIKRPR